MEYDIIIMTDDVLLEKKINRLAQDGWVLIGPIAVGINKNGNTIYIATMERHG